MFKSRKLVESEAGQQTVVFPPSSPLRFPCVLVVAGSAFCILKVRIVSGNTCTEHQCSRIFCYCRTYFKVYEDSTFDVLEVGGLGGRGFLGLASTLTGCKVFIYYFSITVIFIFSIVVLSLKCAGLRDDQRADLESRRRKLRSAHVGRSRHGRGGRQSVEVQGRNPVPLRQRLEP